MDIILCTNTHTYYCMQRFRWPFLVFAGSLRKFEPSTMRSYVSVRLIEFHRCHSLVQANLHVSSTEKFVSTWIDSFVLFPSALSSLVMTIFVAQRRELVRCIFGKIFHCLPWDQTSLVKGWSISYLRETIVESWVWIWSETRSLNIEYVKILCFLFAQKKSRASIDQIKRKQTTTTKTYQWMLNLPVQCTDIF